MRRCDFWLIGQTMQGRLNCRMVDIPGATQFEQLPDSMRAGDHIAETQTCQPEVLGKRANNEQLLKATEGSNARVAQVLVIALINNNRLIQFNTANYQALQITRLNLHSQRIVRIAQNQPITT